MKLRALLVVMCAALLVVPAAFAEMSANTSLSADVETNTTVSGDSTEVSGGDDVTSFVFKQTGEVGVALESKLEADTGWFAAGKGKLTLASDGGASAGDVWIQIGKVDGSDIQVGRFGLNGAFSKGQDIYIASAPGAPSRYQGDYWKGEFDGDADTIALHFGGVELGFILGSGDDTSVDIAATDPTTGQVTTSTETFGTNIYAIRPQYKFGGESFTLKVAGEYGMSVPQSTTLSGYNNDNKFQDVRYGGAVDASFVFGASTVGVSAAYGMKTGKNFDDSDMTDTTETAAFGWWKMAVGESNTLGLGAGWAKVDVDGVSADSKVEGYVSFSQQLPVEGLKIKYGASYAVATLEPEGCDSTSNSGYGARVRLNYDF